MTLAVEWAQFGILVNAVAPGIILSSGTAQYPPQILERGIRETPLKRAGTVRGGRRVDRVPRVAGGAVHHRRDAAPRRRPGAVGPHLGDPVMDLGLAGKLCLVSGASRGIGRAIALALAREGARVAAVARGAGGSRRAARASCRGGGRTRRSSPTSRPPTARTRRSTAACAALGGIDVVVANVGKSFARDARGDGRRRPGEVARHEPVERGARRAARGAAPRWRAAADRSR